MALSSDLITLGAVTAASSALSQSGQGRSTFKSNYETSPIMLQGGLAGSTPGGGWPISMILGVIATQVGILGSTIQLGEQSVNNFFQSSTGLNLGLGDPGQEPFASFLPVSGSELLVNEIGRYSFANQATAANAMIAQSTHCSLLMICPARGPNGYAVKTQIMGTLVATLKRHIALGGYFTVVTPSITYDGALLMALRDVSGGETQQTQVKFQYDFEVPIISQAGAQQQLNSMMSKMDNGSRVLANPDGSISWNSPSVAPGSPQIGLGDNSGGAANLAGMNNGSYGG